MFKQIIQSIIPQDTLLRADKYLNELQLDRTLPGKRLQPLIKDEELKQFQSSDLLGKLLTPKSLRFLQSQKSLVMVLTGTD